MQRSGELCAQMAWVASPDNRLNRMLNSGKIGRSITLLSARGQFLLAGQSKMVAANDQVSVASSAFRKA